jgi:beta-alanine--pyruvate transaminase
MGGMVANRKMFASMMMSGVDHLPHTLNLSQMAFSKGQPTWNAHLAEELERIVALHDANTIAAVILEPVQGSTGVIVRGDIYEDIIKQGGQEQAIEFFHGYTYSGHPIPTAAAHAVLDIFESDDLVNKAKALEPILESGLHAMKGKTGINDIRNFGLSGAIELEPVPGKPGLRALKVLEACIERGALVRVAGDVIAVGPPFISEAKEIEFLCSVLDDSVDAAMQIT